MENKYILGKDIAQKKDQETLEFVQECKQKGKRIPKLVNIAVGHNEASASYMKGLQKKCDALQVILENKILAEDVSEAELVRLIHNYNKSNSVDGILLQMPLPAHFDTNRVVSEIDPMKDIDGMHPLNVGYFSKGQDGFVPCTALSAMEFIHASGINLKGKKVVVVGRSNVIGKPVALLCLNENASVTIVHSKSEGIEEICANADVLIAAVGKAKLLKADWIKKGAVVIDIGVNIDENGKLCGDVDCENVLEKVSRITPVPRGVGVVTNSMLLQNLIKAYKKGDNMEYDLNDIVEMKKEHPCRKSKQWKIIRMGADIRIKCLGCGASVLFPRREFEKKCKKVVVRATESKSEE